MDIEWYATGIYPVNTLAKFTSEPGLVHWRAALRVLGFLNTTKHYCIRYAQQHFNENITSGGYIENGFRSYLTCNVMLMRVMQRMLIHEGVQLGTSSLYQEDLYHDKAACKQQ